MIPNTDIEGAGFLYPLDLIATVLSLGGSIVLFCLCLRMQSTFMLSLKFILAISIADFFYSIANVLSNFQNSSTESLCTVEAILRQCSFILSIFFSTCTAIASYKSAEPQSKFNRPRFFILSVTVGPIIFFSVSILGLILFPNYVIIEMGLINCTITCADITDESLMLMVEMFYRGMPITVGLIIIIFGYTKAIKQLKEFPKQLAGDMQFNVYHLLWYPAASIITFFPSVIDPIVEIYTSERPVLVRALRMAIPHLIGFTNAVVYIILRELYKQRAKTITEKNSGLESGFVTLSESSL